MQGIYDESVTGRSAGFFLTKNDFRSSDVYMFAGVTGDVDPAHVQRGSRTDNRF